METGRYPFIEQILAEAAAIPLSECIAPEDPVNEVKGEKVVGEPMPDHLKQLYTLFNRQADRSEKMARAMLAKMLEVVREPDRNEKIRPFLLESKLAVSRFEITKRLFWAQLESEYPDAMLSDNEGVRAGWRVVVSPQKAEPRVQVVEVPLGAGGDVLSQLLGLRGLGAKVEVVSGTLEDVLCDDPNCPGCSLARSLRSQQPVRKNEPAAESTADAERRDQAAYHKREAGLGKPSKKK